MEAGFWISLCALLVSILSAIYARRTINEANKANQIAIHNEKLAIFKSFLKLKNSLYIHGGDLPEDDLHQFYDPSNIAEFYFTQDTSRHITKFINTADEFRYKRKKRERKDRAKELPDDYDEIVNQCYDLLDNLRKQAEALDARFRDELRLIKS